MRTAPYRISTLNLAHTAKLSNQLNATAVAQVYAQSFCGKSSELHSITWKRMSASGRLLPVELTHVDTLAASLHWVLPRFPLRRT